MTAVVAIVTMYGLCAASFGICHLADRRAARRQRALLDDADCRPLGEAERARFDQVLRQSGYSVTRAARTRPASTGRRGRAPR